jgi:hypothetical protein
LGLRRHANRATEKITLNRDPIAQELCRLRYNHRQMCTTAKLFSTTGLQH